LVFRAAAHGDCVASSVVDEACQALGAALGTVVNGLNPEVVVITGGVAESLAALEPRILAAAAEYAFHQALALTRIRIVPGDKRVSMRGAAALALYEMAQAERRQPCTRSPSTAWATCGRRTSPSPGSSTPPTPACRAPRPPSPAPTSPSTLAA